jgi:p-cumate 2,3-dioxygenase beta subunit
MSAATATANVTVTRAQVEDFLYHEAALLDEWRLKEWEELLADDAVYYIPPNDDLAGGYKGTLYIISDDRERIRQRVIRVLDPNCHAEFPRSRLCRLITNVRVMGVEGDIVHVSANFSCYRYRRYQREFVYVGTYQFQLRKSGESFKIKERRVLLAAHELGSLGSVSFIL